MSLKQMSIHPRSWLGGKKLNTAKPRSKIRLARAKEGIERHLENNPNDAAARQRLSNLQTRIASR